MPKIEIDRAPTVSGSKYPTPFDAPCRARVNRQLGVSAGLTQFGVNLTRLPPGTWSSQRHWHTHEDEFIWVLEYPDVDMVFLPNRYSGAGGYARKDGTRY